MAACLITERWLENLEWQQNAIFNFLRNQLSILTKPKMLELTLAICFDMTLSL